LVHLFNNGSDAQGYHENHRPEIDLVFFEIIMPGMNDKETFVGLNNIHAIKVVAKSGCSLRRRRYPGGRASGGGGSSMRTLC
jgi:hypothetical protein